MTGEHDDDADRALALVAQRGDGGERARPIGGADRVGELEHGALAGVGDQLVDVVRRHRARAGVEAELADGEGEARQVVADGVDRSLGQAV